MESLENLNNVFKKIAFSILIIVISTIFIAIGWQIITNIMTLNDVEFANVLVEQKIDKVVDKIYKINSTLCVISIICAIVHMCGRYILKSENTYTSYNNSHNKKCKSAQKSFDFKSKIKNTWPCILLVVFMLWTGVGCMQASMEAAAEANVRLYPKQIAELSEAVKEGKISYEDAKFKNEELNREFEQNLEIANWTSGDRMPNAADRGWNGCDNLKDGYFSFLFYATVVINVIMLGAQSDKLKKWLLRLLMITAVILVILSFFVLVDAKLKIFLNPDTGSYNISQGMIFFNRAIFNNSNHYGYYLCIAAMVCALLFMKDKNIYFKGLSLIGFVFTSFMLIVNNTFGAYLGVMIALAIVFICYLINCLKNLVCMENTRESVIDLAKFSLIVAIFAFFSYTITGADTKYYLEGNYICKKTYVGFTFGERNIVTKNNGNNKVIIRTSDFDLSGDSRVYTINEKELELKPENSEFDENYQYYKLDGLIYKILKDDNTTEIKENGEYSSATIVEKNFTQLFKDINIIVGNNDEVKEENVNNTLISGEASGELSGEISGNVIADNKEDDINEKSGLSEAVSNTGSGRGEVWIKSLDLVEQRPLFGWGLENLLNEFYMQYGINEGRTHNLILQLAGTTGIIGMLLYISAVAVIFFKVLFNFKFINYNIKTRAILFGVSIIVGIFVYVLMQRLLGVLLFSVIAAVFISIVVFLITNVRNVKLRISQWGLIEYITMPTFIAYMISSLFGNSAFYTSPYFMVILGMMIATILYKGNEPVSAEENDEKIEESEEENDEKIEESEEEKKYREKINNLSKDEKEKLINKYKILDIICIALFFCSSVILFNNILINIFNIGLKLVSTIIILRLLFKKKKYIENSAYLYKSVNKLGYLISIIEILINSSQMLFIIINGINILKPPSICIKVCVNIIMIVSLLLNLYSIKKIVDKNSKKVHDESINIKKN